MKLRRDIYLAFNYIGPMEEHTTYSQEQTQELAAKFASSLRPGDVVGLAGQLGAGKTQFVKGVAQGLGCTDNVSSPTFVLMQVYPLESKGRLKQLCHIDAYRLTSSADAFNIGIEEFLERRDTITIIEWPEKISKIIPPDAIYINISLINDKENKRQITIKKPEK